MPADKPLPMQFETLRNNYVAGLTKRQHALREILNLMQAGLAGIEHYKQLAAEAHKLSGSGASYGFPEISERAAKLENALSDGNQDAAEYRTLVTDLIESCDKAAGIASMGTPHGEPKRPTPKKNSSETIQILVLEDDDEHADLLSFALEQAPNRSYDILRARSFAEFESLLATVVADIIISDLHLPDHQGLDTIHNVLRVAGGTPVLVLTGSADHQMGIKSVEAGAQDFVPKTELLSPLLVRAIDFSIQRGRLANVAEQRALTDPLTGLGNRQAFEQRLSAALARNQRNGYGFALAFIDLDGFKAINDTLGHAAGDEVLREVARRALKIARSSDFVARLGGDEFVVLIDGVSNLAHAASAASHFVQSIEEPLALSCCGGRMAAVGASVGLSLCPADGTEAATLTSAADKRMYANKAERKTRSAS